MNGIDASDFTSKYLGVKKYIKTIVQLQINWAGYLYPISKNIVYNLNWIFFVTPLYKLSALWN